MKKLILAVCILMAAIIGCKTTPTITTAILTEPILSEQTGQKYTSAVTPMQIESWEMVSENKTMVLAPPFMAIPVTEKYFRNPEMDTSIRYGMTMYMGETLLRYAFIFEDNVWVFGLTQEINTWEEVHFSEQDKKKWMDDFVEYGKYVRGRST